MITNCRPLAIICGCTARLCQTWSDTSKTAILKTQLICSVVVDDDIDDELDDEEGEGEEDFEGEDEVKISGEHSNITPFETIIVLYVAIFTSEKTGEHIGLVVRALDSGSGDPGSILGRVGVLFP